VIVHFVFGAICVQLLLWAKFADAETPLTINVVVPVFVSVTSLGALVVPATTLPNAIEVGERLADCALLS
jgi:hypothetical protein